jgi:type IV pilus assembly protein PilV
MRTTTQNPRAQHGVSMIEMLITMLILMVGLLGVAGLSAQAQRAEMESYQRVQAILLMRDMASRINANRKVASCYAITTNTTDGTPYLGVGAGAAAACAAGSDATQQARADADLAAWSSALAGAGEAVAGSNIGVMVGGRGCISYDATDQTFLISVAWQGVSATTPPPASLACAKTGGASLYGSESRRRVVSMTLLMATLL